MLLAKSDLPPKKIRVESKKIADKIIVMVPYPVGALYQEYTGAKENSMESLDVWTNKSVEYKHMVFYHVLNFYPNKVRFYVQLVSLAQHFALQKYCDRATCFPPKTLGL
jgi:hypothetical protein